MIRHLLTRTSAVKNFPYYLSSFAVENADAGVGKGVTESGVDGSGYTKYL